MVPLVMYHRCDCSGEHADRYISLHWVLMMTRWTAAMGNAGDVPCSWEDHVKPVTKVLQGMQGRGRIRRSYS